MIHFECDYTQGATKEVLEALVCTNEEQTSGYSEDAHCQNAREMIKQKCGFDVDVHFVVGGTQANLLVISSALRSHEGVLCADTGHINVHETGAIEATGHKVLPLPNTLGKISAQQVAKAFEAHLQDDTHEHMVRPGMVYISHPTEYGTLYTLQEMEELSAVCKQYEVPLFVDGARLGYGMAAMPQVDYQALARLCDAFTIGGTKVGLLFGEAIVLKPWMAKHFRYLIKQKGGLLAKGRLLGVQFEVLMKDDYYTSQAGRANDYAQSIKKAFQNKGISMLCDTVCNQIFPVLKDEDIDFLSKKYALSFWERVDETHSAVRFCTSVLTSKADVDALLSDISAHFETRM